jgi:hypothetical protein
MKSFLFIKNKGNGLITVAAWSEACALAPRTLGSSVRIPFEACIVHVNRGPVIGLMFRPIRRCRRRHHHHHHHHHPLLPEVKRINLFRASAPSSSWSADVFSSSWGVISYLFWQSFRCHSVFIKGSQNIAYLLNMPQGYK